MHMVNIHMFTINVKSERDNTKKQSYTEILVIKFFVSLCLASYAEKYICHKSDPNLESCLINKTNAAVRDLKGGVPQDNIPPFDPMHVDTFTVAGDYGLIDIAMIMENITLYGQSNTEVTGYK